MTEHPDLLDLHVSALFTQDEHGNLVATNDPEPDQVAAPRLYLGRGRSGAVLRFRRGMQKSTCAALRELTAPDLTANDPNSEPVNQAAMVELLATEQPVENIYFGPAFGFPGSEAVANQGRKAARIPSPLKGEGEGEGDPRRGSGISTSHANVPESGNPDPPEVIEISPSNTRLLSPEFAWLADELTVRNPVMAVIVDGATVSISFSARSTPAASEAGVETLPEHRGRRYAGAVTVAWAAEVQRQGRIPLYSTSWTNHASRRVAARLGLIQYATDFHIT